MPGDEHAGALSSGDQGRLPRAAAHGKRAPEATRPRSDRQLSQAGLPCRGRAAGGRTCARGRAAPASRRGRPRAPASRSPRCAARRRAASGTTRTAGAPGRPPRQAPPRAPARSTRARPRTCAARPSVASSQSFLASSSESRQEPSGRHWGEPSKSRQGHQKAVRSRQRHQKAVRSRQGHQKAVRSRRAPARSTRGPGLLLCLAVQLARLVERGEDDGLLARRALAVPALPERL